MYHAAIHWHDSYRSYVEVPCVMAYDDACKTVIYGQSKPKWIKCVYQFDLSQFNNNNTNDTLFYGHVYRYSDSHSATYDMSTEYQCVVHHETMKYRTQYRCTVLDCNPNNAVRECCPCCTNNCGRGCDCCYNCGCCGCNCTCCDRNCCRICWVMFYGIPLGVLSVVGFWDSGCHLSDDSDHNGSFNETYELKVNDKYLLIKDSTVKEENTTMELSVMT